MPLIQSKSKKALRTNIKTEMDAHPGKGDKAQDLAIAYSIQRRAKKNKMASGGMIRHSEAIPERAKSISDAILAKRKRMAEGGMIDDLDDSAEMERRIGDRYEDSAYDESTDTESQSYADGGMVELDNEEEPYAEGFDEANEIANKKELYDDSQLDMQPHDSNEKSDDLSDEDEHDMIAAIRKRIRSRTE